MDKYTKFILTIIAVGIIGINVHLISDKLITNANASTFGTNYFELAKDEDSNFRNAVLKIVDRNCELVFKSVVGCDYKTKFSD